MDRFNVVLVLTDGRTCSVQTSSRKAAAETLAEWVRDDAFMTISAVGSGSAKPHYAFVAGPQGIESFPFVNGSFGRDFQTLCS